MIKAIIFDFDGVIADTESEKFSCLNDILHKHEYHLEKKDFFGMIGKKTAVFLSERFPEMSSRTITSIVQQRKKSLDIKKVKLIKGVRQLLIFLKSKKYAIALTTGSARDIVEGILELNSLSAYFDVLVCGEDFSSSKPDAECYRITLENLRLAPVEVIVIEDSVAGINAAKKMKCRVFALKTYLKNSELSIADRIFRDHAHLLRYFKGILRKE